MTTSSSDLVLGWPAWRAAVERSDARVVLAPPVTAPRLLSLDVFRGFVIASMLLVNNLIWNAATPRQLMHAPWGRGVTFTDMILPWFVFIVGVTIPVSVGSSRARQAGRIARVLRVVRRAALLVALGVALDTVEYRRLTVGMDVLQLLGLSYFVAASLGRAPVWVRLAAAGALLAAYAALISFVPPPGYAAGTLLQAHNIVQYLDDTYLARYGLAGVLSVAPASALALLGTAAGEVLLAGGIRHAAKVGVFAAAGTALVLGGGLWAHTLPASKDLWTPSYVAIAGGLGVLLLGVCTLLFEVVRLRALAFPFAVLGANPIVGYLASALLAIGVMQGGRVPVAQGKTLSLHSAILDPLAQHMGQIPAGWVYTASVMAMWWLVLFSLYRKRLFVRV